MSVIQLNTAKPETDPQANATVKEIQLEIPVDDLAVAREVFTKEAAALTSLAKNLGENFIQAINLLEKSTGKIIVTGMGKSGHIGAKIAATLASTGSPAFFVHPSEASHGDLGMIADNDAVIAIGHSGNSKELSDILAYCQRYGIAVIGITGNSSSSLAQAATVVLLDGVTEEACPLNLAPTSSAVAALALGDAIAVTLMKRRQFKAEDFARFHPGGKLGARLLKVKDVMAQGDDIPLAAETASMRDVILEMTTKNRGGVGIVNAAGKLVGVITDGDLKRHINTNLLEMTAGQVMSGAPFTVKPTLFATAAVYAMQKQNKMMLFVTEEETGKPVGILQIQQCLQAGII